jgi:hypothetical protein
LFHGNKSINNPALSLQNRVLSVIVLSQGDLLLEKSLILFSKKFIPFSKSKEPLEKNHFPFSKNEKPLDKSHLLFPKGFSLLAKSNSHRLNTRLLWSWYTLLLLRKRCLLVDFMAL